MRFDASHVGKLYGHLTVLAIQKARRTRFLCLCSCGTEKSIRAAHIIDGLIVSCGCQKRELLRLARTVHGCANRNHPTPEYRAWRHMIRRCTAPTEKGFKNHGGRGITVCTRWMTDFSAFLADMGARPSSKHSIDRIDNNGNYEPSNCRWATSLQQNRNRRNTAWLEVRGVRKPLTQWADEKGLTRVALYSRLERGWSPEQAVDMPFMSLAERARAAVKARRST